MKKVLFIFALTFGFTSMSCDTCKTCTFPLSPQVRVCMSDYNNDQVAYDAAISALQIGGYTCN